MSNLDLNTVEKREQERNLWSGCQNPIEESPEETRLNTLLEQDEFGDS
jgi:hypothetical protein